MVSELHRAVADAVDLVNAKPGLTYVRLRFAEDPSEVEVLANSASLNGESFAFSTGFETLSGELTELAGIRTEPVSN
jgi:hypothetical protein